VKNLYGIVFAILGSFCFSGIALSVEDDLNVKFDARVLLGILATTQDNTAVQIPSNVSDQQMHAALAQLASKLKPKDANPSILDADKNFEKSLNASQKQGLAKLKSSYAVKHKNGDIKTVLKRRKWSIKPGRGPHFNKGKAKSLMSDAEFSNLSELPEHATGDGWWHWLTTYNGWGLALYANHNFLWYLCQSPSWMLGVSKLPAWVQALLNSAPCAPHNLDTKFSGARFYITWFGAFWYSV